MKQFHEVKTIYCKTGRPEIANDLMGVQQTDVWVILHEQEHWPTPKTRNELIAEIDAALSHSKVGQARAFGMAQLILYRIQLRRVRWQPFDVNRMLVSGFTQLLGSGTMSRQAIHHHNQRSPQITSQLTKKMSTCSVRTLSDCTRNASRKRRLPGEIEIAPITESRS